MHPSSQSELFIIGLGVIVPDHVTIQAQRAISRCARIYSIVQEPAPLWVPAEKLRQIEIINALNFYIDGGIRTDNYDRVAREIIKAAAGGRPIGYVTYGNPMAYDRVAHNLVEYGREAQIQVKVVPGLSSVDTILCDLRVDMAPAIQVYDASWMCVCQMKPKVDAPVVLLQMGNFGSLRAHYKERKGGSMLKELVDYLARFYPLSHRVALVRSTASEDQPSNIRQVSLANLTGVSADDLCGASLYIPELEKPYPNPEIFKKMEDT